jgi:yersiniabactin salicyl-AMP ligase
MNELQRYSAWSESERVHYRQSGYWVDQPLGEQLRLWARQQPTQIALVAGQRRLSYAGLDTLADRLAAGFAARGIRSGNNVLLQLPNCIGLVATLFALFRLGARPILAMPGQQASDIDMLCQLAEPEAWLYPTRYLGNDYQMLAKDIAAKHPNLQHWQVNTDDVLMSTFQHEPQSFQAPHAEDIALLLLSGGSTGTPKLIPRTHADYFYNARRMAEICQLTPQSVYLATLAVAHNFTLSCPGVLGTLLSGGKVVLAQTSGCDEVFPLIEQEKVTFTALVPPLLNLWLECRAWDDSDLSCLQLIQVGGARLESTLAAKVKPTFNCQLQQVFGMAEGLICCTRLDDTDEVILHTQGRPISNADQIRVVDQDGLPVKPGNAGELLTHGPYTIGGYYRAEAQNLQAFTPDHFYRSGDIVRLTAAGNIVVEGRLKEQINRAGEKIGCAEIESLIDSHQSVLGCVVVGVADERLGERICACVQGDTSLTLTILRGYLQQQGLSDYKLPDQLLRVKDWPLTVVGKIDKRQLAAAAQRARVASDNHQTLALQAMPLDVVYHLLENEEECYIAYERDGEWDIGIDSQAQITLYANRAELSLAGLAKQCWQSDNWQEDLQQALNALPFNSWQAYGMSQFELAHLIHGVSPANLPDNVPLLTLFIPRYQVQLSAGRAKLITHSDSDLQHLATRVQHADRTAIVPASETTWLASVAKLVREQDAHGYCQRVAKAVTEIQRGQYQKVILSRRITLAEPVDLLASYHLGRRHNTPARSFAVKLNGNELVGFSPETIVEVSETGAVSTQPLAGTRALTHDEAENKRLRKVLTNDTKEIAEHAVSVKLAMEELATLCVNGSTHVSDFMSVSLRGSVQHLASRVKGQLAPDFNAWHAFGALFPAVTASGIPKHPAIEAIKRLEPHPRGPYSGSVFMFNSQGEQDTALVLRSLYKLESGYALQAGAGIINQSLPERELEETIEKLQSVSRFIIKATR